MAVQLSFNVIGILLSDHQTDLILDLNNDSLSSERACISSFFNLDSSELYRSLLVRYIEACKVMVNISAGTTDADIHTQLINTLASAKRSYSYGENLACIELCALHGEMLTNYLCITSSKNLEESIDRMPLEDQKKIGSEKRKILHISNGLNQTLRIRWLQQASILSNIDKDNLIKVHRIRTHHFHHWSTDSSNQKNNALKSLEKISQVSAKFLELFDSDNPLNLNLNNLQRVERYMKIASHPDTKAAFFSSKKSLHKK
ncbi:hypothetical protein [Legionella spiritensis]|uniref:hypothetical protein n=1 Tax=Legionella spiritensis TaxID=452 RepID=UPI000F6F4950|nr:hypothetical protein [Legionella spiritensis]VEG91759.1 Uncharacterised protein [Legionella spiritensis]